MQRGFACSDNWDVDGRARLIEARVLEVAHDETIIALLFGLNRIVDRPNRTAKFRKPPKIPIRRRHASDLDLDAGRGDFIKISAETVKIRRVLRRIDKALPQHPHHHPRS